jgi:hypothetical protein
MDLVGDYDEFGNYIGPALEEEEEEGDEEGLQHQVRPTCRRATLPCCSCSGTACWVPAADGDATAAPAGGVEQP